MLKDWCTVWRCRVGNAGCFEAIVHCTFCPSSIVLLSSTSTKSISLSDVQAALGEDAVQHSIVQHVLAQQAAGTAAEEHSAAAAAATAVPHHRRTSNLICGPAAKLFRTLSHRGSVQSISSSSIKAVQRKSSSGNSPGTSTNTSLAVTPAGSQTDMTDQPNLAGSMAYAAGSAATGGGSGSGSCSAAAAGGAGAFAASRGDAVCLTMGPHSNHEQLKPYVAAAASLGDQGLPSMTCTGSAAAAHNSSSIVHGRRCSSEHGLATAAAASDLITTAAAEAATAATCVPSAAAPAAAATLPLSIEVPTVAIRRCMLQTSTAKFCVNLGHCPTQVVVHPIGVYKFKGCPDPLPMAAVSTQRLAARRFPAAVPGGKVSRL